jgi:hypothetical protein
VSGTVKFSPEQFAEARRALGLPPDASERSVEAAVVLSLGAADDLIADVDETMDAEACYLASALRLGWLSWELQDTPPPP